MIATQLMGVAPACTSRVLASSWASALIPPEQSLMKKTRYPSAIAETAVWARQTSVHRPAISKVCRPVAATAGRMSAQALVDTRSIGVTSGRTSAMPLISGSLRPPPAAPTVVRMIGTSRALALAAMPARLVTSSPASIDLTENATHGWWSMSTKTELSMVISFGLSDMRRPSGRGCWWRGRPGRDRRGRAAEELDRGRGDAGGERDREAEERDLRGDAACERDAGADDGQRDADVSAQEHARQRLGDAAGRGDAHDRSDRAPEDRARSPPDERATGDEQGQRRRVQPDREHGEADPDDDRGHAGRELSRDRPAHGQELRGDGRPEHHGHDAPRECARRMVKRAR